MRDLLKRIFSGREPETVILAPGSIPQIIHEREAEARTILLTSTAEPIRNIRNASAQLTHIVNTIAGAEHDPQIHPKLKNIAKNTLPQFIRSMKTALAKDLPEDPEDFYTASVEMVKNCLNSLRGPGRYLQIVFPEEIKAARKGVDAIGLEINEITKILGVYRKETSALNAAREQYLTITIIRSDIVKAGERRKRIAARTCEITGRIAEIDIELTNIGSDPQMSEAARQKTMITELEKARDETARTYASLSMTASHVLRKAEKIAIRQKHPQEISALQHAMFLLSDHEIPDTDELNAALGAACPIATRMISEGEIPLKNKEERAVFSDTVSFCSDICATSRRLMDEESNVRSARAILEKNPAILRTESLNREKGQLQAMLAKEIHTEKELAGWQQKENDRIPVLTEDLRKMMGDIMGKNVQFQDDTQESA